MVKINIVEYEPSTGGGGKKDDSVELESMGYAEQLVTDTDVWGGLKQLKVVPPGEIGQVIEVSLDELNQFTGYDGAEVNGVVHKVNQVFVSLEMPFRAEAMPKDTDDRVTKTRRNGTDHTVKRVGHIRLSRVSEDFDPTLYAIPESGRKTRNGSPLTYEKPTDGMIGRMTKWYEQNA